MTAPDEHPPHEPYEGPRGWYYRCDAYPMSWGPFPSKEAVEHMIKAHRFTFPECRTREVI